MVRSLLSFPAKSTLDFGSRVATIPSMPVNMSGTWNPDCSECPEKINYKDEYITHGLSEYEEAYMHIWCGWGEKREEWNG